jgi:endonuclease/exonuclease/phosphatase family metal-dependent hydrolase
MRKFTGIIAALSLALLALVATPAEAARRMTAPKRLHAVSATATTMTLAWAPVRGARAYRVQLSTVRTMKQPRYVRFVRSTGTVTRLLPRKRYYFRVRVVSPRPGPYNTGARPTAVTKAVPRPVVVPPPVKPPVTPPPVVTPPVTPPPVVTPVTPPPVVSPPVTPPPVVSPPVTEPVTEPVTAPAAPPAAPPASEPTTTPAPVPGTGTADVRVASFNIRGVNYDAQAAGDQRPWRERRPVVVQQILRERSDVVGVQEANQSTIYGVGLDYGTTQYNDLLAAVNLTGAHYALTNAVSYNCLRPASSQNCDYTYRGASQSTRILYNTDTLAPVVTGSYKYTNQAVGKTDRYLAWAVFRVKATGGEFLFTNTHLDSYEVPVRVAQWEELITKVTQLSNGRPVVSVGDFNTSKWDAWSEQMLPRMKTAGFGDVLDQKFQSQFGVNPRPLNRVDAWINSYNRFNRDLTVWAYEENHAKIGNNIDYVFASNDIPVRSWRTVVDYDPTTLRMTGVIPSDHNMVTATLGIR